MRVTVIAAKLRLVDFLPVVLAAAVAGCGPAYITGKQFARGAVSPREKWQSSGKLVDPAKAVDGEVLTAAISESLDDASLTVDLGEVCFFNMVAINHGPNEMGFCKRVALETSMDGRTFTTRAEVSGTRKVTVISLITPVLARYIRLKAVVRGEIPWSIAEIHLQ